MLWTIAIVLLVLWALGMVTSYYAQWGYLHPAGTGGDSRADSPDSGATADAVRPARTRGSVHYREDCCF